MNATNFKPKYTEYMNAENKITWKVFVDRIR